MGLFPWWWKPRLARQQRAQLRAQVVIILTEVALYAHSNPPAIVTPQNLFKSLDGSWGPIKRRWARSIGPYGCTRMILFMCIIGPLWVNRANKSLFPLRRSNWCVEFLSLPMFL